MKGNVRPAPTPLPMSSLVEWNLTKAFTSMAWVCTYLQGFPLRVWVLAHVFLRVPQAHSSPTSLNARSPPSARALTSVH